MIPSRPPPPLPLPSLPLWVDSELPPPVDCPLCAPAPCVPVPDEPVPVGVEPFPGLLSSAEPLPLPPEEPFPFWELFADASDPECWLLELPPLP